MSKRLKIYVAGPITARGANVHEAPRITHQNIMRAAKVGLELIKKGHLPFVPHLTHFMYLESDVEFPPNFWYEFDDHFLPDCDALFYISPSVGADHELRLAKKHGLKIFRSLSEVPEAKIEFAHVVKKGKI